MSISLLDLPMELIDHVFQELDHKSLLKMRQVCKTTKQLAEAKALNQIETPVIDKLTLSAMEECTVTFECSHSVQSRMFLVAAVNCLQLSGFSYHSKNMTATMPSSEAASFINRVKPLIAKSNINVLDVPHSTIEAHSLISLLLEGESVPPIAFHVGAESSQTSDLCLKLVGQLKTTEVRLHLTHSHTIFDNAHFLQDLAEIVDKIAVTATANSHDELDEDSLIDDYRLLVTDILEARCSHLDLSDALIGIDFNDASEIAADLAKVWSGSEKEIYFTAPSLQTLRCRDVSDSHSVVVVRDRQLAIDRYRIIVRLF